MKLMVELLFYENQIEEIKALGEKMDPNKHQAMMEVEDENKDPGTIVQEIQGRGATRASSSGVWCTLVLELDAVSIPSRSGQDRARAALGSLLSLLPSRPGQEATTTSQSS